jgi:hypothetical protein
MKLQCDANAEVPKKRRIYLFGNKPQEGMDAIIYSILAIRFNGRICRPAVISAFSVLKVCFEK